MPIAKGEAWGEPGRLPADGLVVRSDAEARAAIEQARRAGDEPPVLGLAGGDLARTLGATGDTDRLHGDAAVQFPVDLGAVLVDGRLHWFVAHLIARPPGPLGWWRGRLLAVMNAEYVGAWDVAPRSHPNDGKLDTLECTMAAGERLKARSRLRTGTHVPHPEVTEHRVAAASYDVAGLHVWLDGVPLGPARTLAVRLEPDALTCIV